MQSLISSSHKLHNLLSLKQIKLAAAESCTGGLVSAAMTDRAGSSDFFDRGFITYSNEAKQDLLNVSEATLSMYGAVSEQTAGEMAQGAKLNSLASASLSITGIAGPSGGSPGKPVGTVCFGWCLPDHKTITSTRIFQGDRQKVREQAATFSIEHLHKMLLSMENLD